VHTRTRTQTVVFTDMADYTKSVVNSDREALRNLLAQHQAMVEPVLTRRGGRIVKGLGDSFMALFDSATEAVRACLDLVEAHAPGSAGGVCFRASCATGDVEETSNDAFGETVNLSSRINAKTPAGEVWISASTWHCMNQAEIPWDSTGKHSLKGIPGEVEVFRAVPQHQCILPDVLAAGVRTGKLVTWKLGDPVPAVPPAGHVVLVGHRVGTPALAQAADSLPIVDPSHLWLQAYAIGPAERIEWSRHGRGMLISTPAALDATIARLSAPVHRPVGSETIILDGGAVSVVNLVLAGLGLPAVPYAEVVAGYSYDLLSDGRWVNQSDRALVRVDVSSAGATVAVLAPGAVIDGQSTPVNSTVALKDGMVIHTSAGSFKYSLLNAEGYLGVLLGDSQIRLGVASGQRVELGREPQHPGLLLPDRNSQDNIRWCAGPRAARAREKYFTMDKSLTGRRQTVVAVEGNRVTVEPIHPTCPTVILPPRGPAVRVPSARLAGVNDALLLGTTVVAIRDATPTSY